MLQPRARRCGTRGRAGRGGPARRGGHRPYKRGRRGGSCSAFSSRSSARGALRSHEHWHVPVPHGGSCLPAPQLLHLLFLLPAGGGRGLREARQQVGAAPVPAAVRPAVFRHSPGRPGLLSRVKGRLGAPGEPAALPLRRRGGGTGTGALFLRGGGRGTDALIPGEGGSPAALRPGVGGVAVLEFPREGVPGGSLLTPSLSALFQRLRSQRGGHRQQDRAGNGEP